MIALHNLSDKLLHRTSACIPCDSCVGAISPSSPAARSSDVALSTTSIVLISVGSGLGLLMLALLAGFWLWWRCSRPAINHVEVMS